MQESGFCWNNGSHTCLGILSLPRCWSTVPRQPPSPWPWQNLSGCGYTPVRVAPSMHPTVPKSGFQLIALVAVGTRHKISPSHKLRSVLNTALIFRQHSKCTRLIRDADGSFSLCVAYLRFPGTNFTRQRAIFVRRQSVFLPCPWNWSDHIQIRLTTGEHSVRVGRKLLGRKFSRKLPKLEKWLTRMRSDRFLYYWTTSGFLLASLVQSKIA